MYVTINVLVQIISKTYNSQSKTNIDAISHTNFKNIQIILSGKICIQNNQ